MHQPGSPPTPRWLLPLLGWAGIAAALAWGLVEATFFFIVPDVLITLLVMFSVKTSVRAMALVTADEA